MPFTYYVADYAIIDAYFHIIWYYAAEPPLRHFVSRLSLRHIILFSFRDITLSFRFLFRLRHAFLLALMPPFSLILLLRWLIRCHRFHFIFRLLLPLLLHAITPMPLVWCHFAIFFADCWCWCATLCRAAMFRLLSSVILRFRATLFIAIRFRRCCCFFSAAMLLIFYWCFLMPLYIADADYYAALLRRLLSLSLLLMLMPLFSPTLLMPLLSPPMPRYFFLLSCFMPLSLSFSRRSFFILMLFSLPPRIFLSPSLLIFSSDAAYCYYATTFFWYHYFRLMPAAFDDDAFFLIDWCYAALFIIFIIADYWCPPFHFIYFSFFISFFFFIAIFAFIIIIFHAIRFRWYYFRYAPLITIAIDISSSRLLMLFWLRHFIAWLRHWLSLMLLLCWRALITPMPLLHYADYFSSSFSFISRFHAARFHFMLPPFFADDVTLFDYYYFASCRWYWCFLPFIDAADAMMMIIAIIISRYVIFMPLCAFRWCCAHFLATPPMFFDADATMLFFYAFFVIFFISMLHLMPPAAIFMRHAVFRCCFIISPHAAMMSFSMPLSLFHFRFLRCFMPWCWFCHCCFTALFSLMPHYAAISILSLLLLLLYVAWYFWCHYFCRFAIRHFDAIISPLFLSCWCFDIFAMMMLMALMLIISLMLFAITLFSQHVLLMSLFSLRWCRCHFFRCHLRWCWLFLYFFWCAVDADIITRCHFLMPFRWCHFHWLFITDIISFIFMFCSFRLRHIFIISPPLSLLIIDAAFHFRVDYAIFLMPFHYHHFFFTFADISLPPLLMLRWYFSAFDIIFDIFIIGFLCAFIDAYYYAFAIIFDMITPLLSLLMRHYYLFFDYFMPLLFSLLLRHWCFRRCWCFSYFSFSMIWLLLFRCRFYAMLMVDMLRCFRQRQRATFRLFARYAPRRWLLHYMPAFDAFRCRFRDTIAVDAAAADATLRRRQRHDAYATPLAPAPPPRCRALPPPAMPRWYALSLIIFAICCHAAVLTPITDAAAITLSPCHDADADAAAGFSLMPLSFSFLHLFSCHIDAAAFAAIDADAFIRA